MLYRRKFDIFLFLPSLLLIGVGILMIASVSPSNLSTHLFSVFISLLFFFIFSFLDLEIIFSFSPFIYIFGVIFLILPFFLGTITRGAVRWIPVFGMTIQPSEIIKPFLAIVSAWYWTRIRKQFSVKTLFIYILFSLPVLALIFFQPDLGSTLAVLCIFAGTIFISPIKPKQILFLSLIVLSALPLLWFSLRDYQRLRVIHFINPYSDPLGQGYNVIQSKITVGSGNLFGRGLGRGTQSHLYFLPERHTDFIFASLAEETGLIGCIFLLLLYFFLLSRILKLAKLSLKNKSIGNSFFILVMGIYFFLFFQIAVNIGMNLGLLPITGITLPLVSYGGSSLLTTMISLGILESVFRSVKEEEIINIR